MIITSLLLVFLTPSARAGELMNWVLASAPALEGPALSGVPVGSPQVGSWGDAEVARALSSGGVAGMVHGSVAEERAWVLAVTNPEDMFDQRFYPLRSANTAVARALAGLVLERHDSVRVRGRMRSDPPHILVERIEVLRRDPTDLSNRAAELRLPLDLRGKKEFEIKALVHAVLRGGHQVAVEYRNHILPLSLEDPADTKAAAALAGLWRNDIIQVRVKVRGSPQRPTHLVLADASAVTVLERVRNMHGKNMSVEGPLVLFPRAAGLRRDVWAVAVSSPSAGVTRYITLNNFSDPGKWTEMDERLRQEWDRRKGGIEQGRNKFINPGLVVRAQGEIVDLTGAGEGLARNQANQTLEVSELEFLPSQTPGS